MSSLPRAPCFIFFLCVLIALTVAAAAPVDAAVTCTGQDFYVDSALKTQITSAKSCRIFMDNVNNAAIRRLNIGVLQDSSVYVRNSMIAFVEVNSTETSKGGSVNIVVTGNTYVKDSAATGAPPVLNFVRVGVTFGAVSLVNVSGNTLFIADDAFTPVQNRDFFLLECAPNVTGAACQVDRVAVTNNVVTAADVNASVHNSFMRVAPGATAAGGAVTAISGAEMNVSRNRVTRSYSPAVMQGTYFFVLHDIGEVLFDSIYFADNDHLVSNISARDGDLAGPGAVVRFIHFASTSVQVKRSFAVLYSTVNYDFLQYRERPAAGSSSKYGGVNARATITFVEIADVRHADKNFFFAYTYNVSGNLFRVGRLPLESFTGYALPEQAGDLTVVFVALMHVRELAPDILSRPERVLALRNNRFFPIMSAGDNITLHAFNVTFVATNHLWTNFTADFEYYRVLPAGNVTFLGPAIFHGFAFERPPLDIAVRDCSLSWSLSGNSVKSCDFVWFSVSMGTRFASEALLVASAVFERNVYTGGSTRISASAADAITSRVLGIAFYNADLAGGGTAPRVQSLRIADNKFNVGVAHERSFSLDMAFVRLWVTFANEQKTSVPSPLASRAVELTGNLFRSSSSASVGLSLIFVDVLVLQYSTGAASIDSLAVSSNNFTALLRNEDVLPELQVSVSVFRLATSSANTIEINKLLAVNDNRVDLNVVRVNSLVFLNASLTAEYGLAINRVEMLRNVVDASTVHAMWAPAVFVPLIYLPIGRYLSVSQHAALGAYTPTVELADNIVVAGKANDDARPLSALFFATACIMLARSGWFYGSQLSIAERPYDVLMRRNVINITNRLASTQDVVAMHFPLLYFDAPAPLMKTDGFSLSIDVADNAVNAVIGPLDGAAGKPVDVTKTSFVTAVHVERIKLDPKAQSFVVTFSGNRLNVSATAMHLVSAVSFGEGTTGGFGIDTLVLTAVENSLALRASRPRVGVADPVYCVFINIPRGVSKLQLLKVERTTVAIQLASPSFDAFATIVARGGLTPRAFAAVLVALDGGNLDGRAVDDIVTFAGNRMSVTAAAAAAAAAGSDSQPVLFAEEWGAVTLYGLMVNGYKVQRPLAGIDVSGNALAVDVAGMRRFADSNNASSSADLISVSVFLCSLGSGVVLSQYQLDRNTITVLNSGDGVNESAQPARVIAATLLAVVSSSASLHRAWTMARAWDRISHNVVTLRRVHVTECLAIVLPFFSANTLSEIPADPTTWAYRINVLNNSLDASSVFAVPNVVSNFSLVVASQLLVSRLTVQFSSLRVGIVRASGATMMSPVVNANVGAALLFTTGDVTCTVECLDNRVEVVDAVGAIDPRAPGTTIAHVDTSAVVLYARAITSKARWVGSKSGTARYSVAGNNVTLACTHCTRPAARVALFFEAPVDTTRHAHFDNNSVELVAERGGPCEAIVAVFSSGWKRDDMQLAARRNRVRAVGCAMAGDSNGNLVPPPPAQHFFIACVVIHSGPISVTHGLIVQENELRLVPSAATPAQAYVRQFVAALVMFDISQDTMAGDTAVPTVRSITVNGNTLAALHTRPSALLPSLLLLVPFANDDVPLFADSRTRLRVMSELHVAVIAAPVSFNVDLKDGGSDSFRVDNNVVALLDTNLSTSNAAAPTPPPPPIVSANVNSITATVSLIHFAMLPSADASARATALSTCVITVGAARTLTLHDNTMNTGAPSGTNSVSVAVFMILGTVSATLESSDRANLKCTDWFAGSARSLVSIERTRSDMPSTTWAAASFSVVSPRPRKTVPSARLLRFPFLALPGATSAAPAKTTTAAPTTGPGMSTLAPKWRPPAALEPTATPFRFLCNQWSAHDGAQDHKQATIDFASALQENGLPASEITMVHRCSRTQSRSVTVVKIKSKTRTRNGTRSEADDSASASWSATLSDANETPSRGRSPSDATPSATDSRSRLPTPSPEMSPSDTRSRHAVSPTRSGELTQTVALGPRPKEGVELALAITAGLTTTLAAVAAVAAPVPSLLFTQARQQAIQGLIEGVLQGSCRLPVPDGSAPSPAASPLQLAITDGAFRYTIGTVVGNIVFVPLCGTAMLAISFVVSWLFIYEDDDDADDDNNNNGKRQNPRRRNSHAKKHKSTTKKKKSAAENDGNSISNADEQPPAQPAKPPPRPALDLLTLLERAQIGVLLEVAIALLFLPTCFAAVSLGVHTEVHPVGLPFWAVGLLLLGFLAALGLLAAALRGTLGSVVVQTAQFHFKQQEHNRGRDLSGGFMAACGRWLDGYCEPQGHWVPYFSNHAAHHDGSKHEPEPQHEQAHPRTGVDAPTAEAAAAVGEAAATTAPSTPPPPRLLFDLHNEPNAATRIALRNRMRDLNVMRRDQVLFTLSEGFFDTYGANRRTRTSYKNFFLAEMGAQIGIVIAWIIAHYLPENVNCTFLGISTCLLFFLYLVYLLARRPIIIPIELYVVVLATGVEFVAALAATLLATAAPERRHFLHDMEGVLVFVNLSLGVCLLLIWLRSNSPQTKRFKALLHRIRTGDWPERSKKKRSKSSVKEEEDTLENDKKKARKKDKHESSEDEDDEPDELSDEVINMALVGTAVRDDEAPEDAPPAPELLDLTAALLARSAKDKDKKKGAGGDGDDDDEEMAMMLLGESSGKCAGSLPNSDSLNVSSRANVAVAAARPDEDICLVDVDDTPPPTPPRGGVAAAEGAAKGADGSRSTRGRPTNFEELDAAMRAAYAELLLAGADEDGADASTAAATSAARPAVDGSDSDTDIVEQHQEQQKQLQRQQKMQAKLREYMQLRAQLDEFSNFGDL